MGYDIIKTVEGDTPQEKERNTQCALSSTPSSTRTPKRRFTRTADRANAKNSLRTCPIKTITKLDTNG
jgi:hypothetical protein